MRLLACLVVIIGVVVVHAEEAKRLKPNRNWTGVVKNEALKKEVPKGQLISDAKAFAKVWKAWRKDEKVPAIDFRKELVVFTYWDSPNEPHIVAYVKDGKLTVAVSDDEIFVVGPGFGYSLATFDRKGIKQVNDEKLP